MCEAKEKEGFQLSLPVKGGLVQNYNCYRYQIKKRRANLTFS